MTAPRLNSVNGRTPDWARRNMRNSHIPQRGWDAGTLSRAVGEFLRELRQANLSKELQAALSISPSTAEKMIRGEYPISGHLLMNLDALFGGELLRTLRRLPEPDETSRRILELTEKLRRVARDGLG